MGYGELNINSNSILNSSNLIIGSQSSGEGIINLIENTSTYTNKNYSIVGSDGTGTININNDTQMVNMGLMIVGEKTNGSGFINIDNGIISGVTDLHIGESGSGTIKLKNNSTLSVGHIKMANESGSKGFLEIIDSSVDLKGISSAGGGISTIILSNANLNAKEDNLNFISNISNIYLRDQNSIINTNQKNIGITSAISNLPGTTGGLVIEGFGTTTLSGANTYNGPTVLSNGSLIAGIANTFSPNSDHVVSSSSLMNLNSFNQTVKGLTNNGTIQLSDGSAVHPSTTLKITDAYTSNNGVLNISTVLENDNSASDKLIFSGPSAIATGQTLVNVTNAGGLGALTTEVGIPVVLTENGAKINFKSFILAGEHVDAGAYEYRLYQDETRAVLRSDTFIDPTSKALDPDPEPGFEEEIPTYRNEVPLIASLPSQISQADLNMLGDYHKRFGDSQNIANNTTQNNSWARFIRTSPEITQTGTNSPKSKGHIHGLQAGLNLYKTDRFNGGIYIGELSSNFDVKGFAGGIFNKNVGSNHIRTRYIGLYGTYLQDNGLYIDTVFQGANIKSTINPEGKNGQLKIKGHSFLASIEAGRAFQISGDFYIEPQAQLIYYNQSFNGTQIRETHIDTNSKNKWIGRIGARAKTRFSFNDKKFEPYARINLYTSKKSADTNTYTTPAAITQINTNRGFNYTELAFGGTLSINKNTNIYTELGKLWSNGGNDKTKSNLQASIGIKINW